MSGHICFGVGKDFKCRFEGACYGEICIAPSICSKKRLTDPKDIRTVIGFLRNNLKEQKIFNGWIAGCEKTQKKNIKSNILYLKRKIKYYQNILKKRK